MATNRDAFDVKKVRFNYSNSTEFASPDYTEVGILGLTLRPECHIVVNFYWKSAKQSQSECEWFESFDTKMNPEPGTANPL